jgi:hypothetical protein
MADRSRPIAPQPTKAQRRARHAAEQSRYRARVATGQRIARAPFDSQVIDFMVATKWLDPKCADNADAVGCAYYAMIKDAAKKA